MKKITGSFARHFSRSILTSLSAVMLIGSAGGVMAADTSAGITDTEIRDVVSRVAKHQIHALTDGDYAAVQSVEAAKAAKAPQGIAWSYPWGVTLFGMLHSTDVTGDKEADNFVVQHNLICARYYAWLAGLKSSVT